MLKPSEVREQIDRLCLEIWELFKLLPEQNFVDTDVDLYEAIKYRECVRK